MNEFGDLLGTPYAPVSKIAPVKRSKIHIFFLTFLSDLNSNCSNELDFRNLQEQV